MASLRIKSGANHSIIQSKKPHKINHSKSPLFLPNPSKKSTPQAVSASMASSLHPSLHHQEESSIHQQKDSIFPSKLDDWVQQSAQDIVKSLKQAPLLVHIYDNNGKTELKTEKGILEDWPIVKSEWEEGKIKSPDGLIFVEEIEAVDERNEDGLDGGDDFEEGVTRAWGVVVQGKGVEFGPACYLLKTSRVCGGLGLGLCCTHFCLMRVKSFNQSALRQFKDSWLLR